MRPIALALGGGAGLGWAHIGALRALEDANIQIGAAAGTSIGALAAVCLGAHRLDALEDIARSAKLRTILRYLDPHFKPGAMLGGRMIAKQLDRHLGHATFENLSIPVAAVAADLNTGQAVILRTGPVAEAVRASMALPGIFHPALKEGHILVDGGTVMPVPVEAARLIAPELPVVAINLQGDYTNRAKAVGLSKPGRNYLSTLSIMRASFGLVLSQLAKTTLDLCPPEILISPPVGHVDVQNFTKAHELIEIGRRAIEDALPEIRNLQG